MCGRYFSHGVSWEEYAAAMTLVNIETAIPPQSGYNIAPTQFAPIFRRSETQDGLEIAPAMWGLVPSWWKKPLEEKKFTTFNARSETVHESRVYSSSFRKRRCLVPASGYYEWSGSKGDKTPYAIGLKNRRWFCFAGLWSRTLIANDNGDPQPLDSFTIMTTTPNDQMGEIHNRMPVILRPEHYTIWTSPDGGVPDDLFTPYPGEDMQAWPVGKAVGNVRNQGVELIDVA